MNRCVCFKHVLQSMDMAATAAAMRVVKNSSSLTAVNMYYPYGAPLSLLLLDLLAAGLASGLATRLRKLTGIAVEAACADQQLQALRQGTGLTHLDISGGHLQDCPAVEVAAALQAMPRLTRLHMRSCNLQSQRVVAALASALRPLTQLQHLCLSGSRLGEAGAASLAPALSAMPGLQTLDVSSSYLREAAGAKALCTLLGAVLRLTHLDVNNNVLWDEGAALLLCCRASCACRSSTCATYTLVTGGWPCSLHPLQRYSTSTHWTCVALVRPSPSTCKQYSSTQ